MKARLVTLVKPCRVSLTVSINVGKKRNSVFVLTGVKGDAAAGSAATTNRYTIFVVIHQTI